jgi:hypothetical protein
MCRRFATYPVLAAFLVAFFLAPFQHRHVAGAPGGSPDSAVVHSHPYAIDVPDPGERTNIKDAHVASALDTFKFELASAPVVPFQIETLAVLPVSHTHSHETIQPVETCAHDPPAITFSAPRSPPL